MKGIFKASYLLSGAVVFGILALLPASDYIRCIPAGIGAVFALYSLALLIKPAKIRISILWILTILFTLGILILSVTGALILHAGGANAEPDCDYVIVLGSKSEDGTPSDTLNERIQKALTYLNEHPHTIAVLSGGQGEAECMRDALTAAGIAESRLWLERKSTSTWENMKFSLSLIRENTEKEPESIGIISSEFHIFRAQIYVSGLKTTPIPAKTQDFSRWLHYFIREIAGVWHYIILGGTYD